MDLIIHDRSKLSAKVAHTKPMLRIYKSNVVLYPELLALLGVAEGDRVKFAIDAKNPKDYYISKDNENGVLCRKYCKTNSLQVLLSSFTKLVPLHWQKQSIAVGTEAITLDGIDWYPIITAPLDMVPTEIKPTTKSELFNPNSVRDQY